MTASVDDLEQLYRDRYSTFRDILSGVVGSHDLAREVVQEAFTRALRERKKFRGDGSLEAWVWKIALNFALRRRRQLRREWHLDEYEAPAREQPRMDNVRDAVRALPPRCRLIVFLRYYADHSYTEIAQIVGISEGTVASTLSRAREELMDLLPEEEEARI